ncbi:F0F1-type ATP synthase membrane subunit a [Paraburkholderia bryophila]|uniref:F0F1-type ATP synthase membrane subunit a n=1 Tax=Paraburkholderia bryophila TaxID=420952 RepID=A0A7Y9W4I6_9BURK|nr:F0F1-type ATP synthase membrane subunit a [Paraburkholderia bryophila]
MTASPLATAPLLHLGPLSITEPVLATWAIIILVTVMSAWLTRNLSLTPGKVQTVQDLLIETIDQQIRDIMQTSPATYRALIGTLFLFVLIANWSALLPGMTPPTAHLETDAALALIVLGATIFYGIRARGTAGYFAAFAEPS